MKITRFIGFNISDNNEVWQQRKLNFVICVGGENEKRKTGENLKAKPAREDYFAGENISWI